MRARDTFQRVGCVLLLLLFALRDMVVIYYVDKTRKKEVHTFTYQVALGPTLSVVALHGACSVALPCAAVCSWPWTTCLPRPATWQTAFFVLQ